MAWWDAIRETFRRAPAQETPRDWRDVFLDHVQERLAELELALEEQDWTRLSAEAQFEFSRRGLHLITAMARLFYLKNPLVNRAVEVQRFYVWGQDWAVEAQHPEINAVIQAFLDDEKNRPVLTSQLARELREVDLITTGNVFFVFFVHPATGRVRVRTIPVDEIEDIITNPDDRSETWFYKRTWLEPVTDFASGHQVTVRRTAYYPDWKLDLRDRDGRPMPTPNRIGDHPVMVDTPVFHVKTGGLPEMRFGVPEQYAALDWARAAKEHLEDWVSVWRSLSQFTWQLKGPRTPTGVAAARNRIATTVGLSQPIEANPPTQAGSTFVSTAGMDLQPVRTTGVRPSPDEGRRLWLMVAAGVGLPETFFGDADVGNLATARTLDRPTELRFLARRKLWADVYGQIFAFVIDWGIKAPGGPLTHLGHMDLDADGLPIIVMNPDEMAEPDDTGERPPVNRHVDVNFPDLLERDVTERVNAIISAATLDGKKPAGTMTRRQLVSLLLTAIGLDDIDEILDEMFPDDAGDAVTGYLPGPEEPEPVGFTQPEREPEGPENPISEREERRPARVRKSVEYDTSGRITAITEEEIAHVD